MRMHVHGHLSKFDLDRISCPVPTNFGRKRITKKDQKYYVVAAPRLVINYCGRHRNGFRELINRNFWAAEEIFQFINGNIPYGPDVY
jgi:hypothetical protein